MGNGVTVIFGTIRKQPVKASMAGLSGPPPGSWAKPCGAVASKARRARPDPRTPITDETTKGRDFSRRVRTFIGG